MRTEKEILKDFEQLGYKINEDYSAYMIRLEKENKDYVLRIDIDKSSLGYCKYEITKSDCSERTIYVRFWEHKLIHELFECWGWL